MAAEPQPMEGFVDVDSETAPGVGKDRLYRLWEEGNWSAKALDFTQDAVDWRETLTDEQRRALLWNMSMFLDGEESVTITLAPFVEAAPGYENKIFLATQVADEARHHVFFDRFLREVCGIGSSYASTLEATQPNLSWGYRHVFDELDRLAEKLRLSPRRLPLLAQGVVLYHIVVEGMLAHTGQHYFRDYCQRRNLFPGFAAGIHMVTRDESRHIAFGVQVLRELVTSDPACKAAVIQMLNKVLPWAAGVLVPPGTDWSYLTSLGYSAQEVFTFALRSVATKLRRAGIQPDEVLALVKLGAASRPPAEQASRVIRLIDGGVLGTDQPVQAPEETLAVLFASIGDVAAWTQGRRQPVQGTIQWLFNDAQPRYVQLVPGQAPLVEVGKASAPTVTLRCHAADWIAMARGSLKQQQALLTGRLRIHGDWRTALQLPRILPV